MKGSQSLLSRFRHQIKLIKELINRKFRKRRLLERELLAVVQQISENVHSLNLHRESERERLQTIRDSIESHGQELGRIRNHQQFLLQQQELHAFDSRGTESHTIDGPLVSVIMPVWNRAERVRRSLQSILDQTYSRWELLIVDDGSEDGTVEVIQGFTNDQRIRLFTSAHQGVSAARNQALSQAEGEIVTYLDSDNVWVPRYLEMMVQEFNENPECDTAYAALLLQDSVTGQRNARDIDFDWERHRDHGGIDLNVFAHRTSLYEDYGGFDEELVRLVDWDLIIRYTEHHPPRRLGAIGCIYEDGPSDRITTREPLGPSDYQLQRKWQRPTETGLRVLYVLSEYPQLTETYIRWEIECMERWGVEVHVWSERENTASPYQSDTPHHLGTLEESIRHVRPNIVHFHGMNLACKHLNITIRTGCLVTVRGDQIDRDPQTLDQLLGHSSVVGVFNDPRVLEGRPDQEKSFAIKPGINAELYYPGTKRDHTLVVQVAEASSSNSMECFIDTAVLCPLYRFQLILRVNKDNGQMADTIIQYNQLHGSPVDIRINPDDEETASYMRQAGIYLHTVANDVSFGIPITIPQAMACGAYVVIKDLPGAREYAGSHAAYYHHPSEAADIIGQTMGWYEERWKVKSNALLEYAYENYPDLRVHRPLLDLWKHELNIGVDPAEIIDIAFDSKNQAAIDLVHSISQEKSQSAYGRSLMLHLFGTYQILDDWGCSEEVCQAGLVHSIYSSIFVNRFAPTIENREALRSATSERAEKLTYLFQSSFRHHFLRHEVHNAPRKLINRYVDEDVTVDEHDFKDLCIIFLGEWLEKSQRMTFNGKIPGVYQQVAELLGGQFLEKYLRVTGEHNLASVLDQKAA